MKKTEVYTKALEALKAGKSGEEMQQAVYGEGEGGSTELLGTEEEGDDPNGILGLLDGDTGETEEVTSEESTEDSDDADDSSTLDILDEADGKEPPAKEQGAEDVEFIRADGKRIKIDYNNRERTKRAYAAEVGMRKFQRERDEARKAAEPLQKKADDFDKLNVLFEEEGVEGVVKQLTGGKTLDDIVQERIDLLVLEQEKPAEAAKLRHEQELARERSARERIERQMESITEQTTRDREAADQVRLESMIKPVFNQYSFAGKLNGDSDAEHAMDEALWNQAFSKLESYPDDVELTPAMIRKEFRAVATTFGKVIRRQVDTRTQAASASQRKNAKESLQQAVAEGTTASDSRKEFAKKFKSGDKLGALKDILKNKVKR